MYLELFVDAFDVAPYRVDSHGVGVANHFVAQSVHQAIEYLHFPFIEFNLLFRLLVANPHQIRMVYCWKIDLYANIGK